MTDETPRRFVVTTVEVEGREERRVVERPAFEPVAWGARARLEVAGRRATRVDAHAKLTGAATYASDVQLPGMLHAVALRAPIARGRLIGLDPSRAEALPGVRAVLTGATIPAIPWLHGDTLLSPRIRYAGQPVAALAADTPAAARRALSLIRARWRARPPHVRLEPTDGPGRGLPAPPFTQRYRRGNVARALRSAAAVVTQTYRVAPVVHHAMETHGSVVWWEGDRVLVHDSTQGIYAVRNELAEHLGLAQHRVRVMCQYMGGGFGAKNACGSYTVLAALLSHLTERPVRFMLDRAEESIDAGHRPETVMRLTLGAHSSGELVALEAEAWVALGADGWTGGPAQIATQLYRCANVRTIEHFRYTNVGPMTSFRAPYHVEGAFALESAMELMARRLRLDPVAFRRRNVPEMDQPRDRPYAGLTLAPCLDELHQRFRRPDTSGASRSVAPSLRGRVLRGRGVACQVWGSGGGPPAYASVRLNRDGSATVHVGTQDLGTGSRTILAQIAAEALGLELARVRVALGDTETGPYCGNSWGSMTTASVGPAVRMAAEDAKRQLLEVASGLLEAPPQSLLAHRGRIVARARRRSIAIERVTESLGDIMIIGHGHRGPNPQSLSVASFGAQAAEVEVDTETGVVRVLQIVAVHDCGRAINPELAESQLHGGIIQGLGYALCERRLHDPALGVVVNGGLHEYKIPTCADIPLIDARIISRAEPAANHTGAKGVGEPPIIPTAPAIANAVFDALGVQPTALPLTPANVLSLLRKRRPGRLAR